MKNGMAFKGASPGVLTYPFALVLAMAFVATGWLMKQGFLWYEGALITFAVTSGTLMITRTPWGSVWRALPRLRLADSTSSSEADRR